MAQKQETTFKQRVAYDLKFFEQKGVLWKSKIQQESIRGVPDYIGCIAGKFLAIELKKDSATPPDALQLYNMRKIEEAGGAYFVAHPDNWGDIFLKITKMADKRRKY